MWPLSSQKSLNICFKWPWRFRSESQHHWAVEVGRHLWRLSSLTAGCSGLCSIKLWISARMETPEPVRVACSSVWPPPIWGRFLCLNGISHISDCAHWLLCFHCIPLRSLALSSHAPISYLYTRARSPWAFSSPGWTIPALSVPSPMSEWIVFLWTRGNFEMSLLKKD